MLCIAAKATTTGSVCPKCGITKKSGKISCCGHGGSWFGNCESTGGMKLGHKWHEGLQSCRVRAQSKTVTDQQLKGAQQGTDGSSNGAGNVKSRSMAQASEPLALTSVRMAGARSIIALARTPANTSTAPASATIGWKPITVSAARSHNDSVDMAMDAPVYALATTSQGRKQASEKYVYITFSLSVMWSAQ